MSTEKFKKVTFFSERLKKSIPKGITQQKLADEIGVSIGAIKKWLSGSAEPSFDNTLALSKALNKSVEWLMTGEEATKVASCENLEKSTNVTILNIYDVEFSAGAGSIIDANTVIEQYALPDTFFNTYGLNKTRSAGVFVRGDSMEPKFHDGDIVVVDRSTRQVENDGIYAFYYEGHCFIKHIQLLGNKLLAISSNPAYKEWSINTHSDFKIIGMVKAAISRI